MTAARSFHASWRKLPVGTLDDVIGTGTALILAPHPDDESLGCGGLIARCVDAGRPPLIAVLTDGTGSHPNSRTYPSDRLRATRMAELRAAIACLGLAADRVVELNQPDTAAPRDGPAFDAVVATVAGLLRQGGFTCILAPWRLDPHCDHEAASRIATAVADTVGIRHVAYPVWGWTIPPDDDLPDVPKPGVRLDIADALLAKRRAIQAHRSQYGDLITDDPDGFRLPPGLLSVFDTPFETFIQP